MIGLERLSEDAVEEGMETPLVKALVRALEEREALWAGYLLAYASQGADVSKMAASGGRVAAYKDVLEMIKNAGKESET